MDSKTLVKNYVAHFSSPFLAVFITVLLIGAACVWISAILTGGEALESLLFVLDNNTFMDFYNVIYIAHSDPYANVGIYPPLTYCVYYLIGMIVLPHVDTPIEINNYDIKLTQTGEMCLFMFFFVCMFLFYKAVQKMTDCKSLEKDLLFLAIVLSPTMLFTIERGNINLLTLVFIMLYLHWFNSENKYLRYVAVSCLALALCTKIYAAVFAVFLLRSDKTKELIIFLALAIVLNTIPFLFIGGDPITYIKNLLQWASTSETGGVSPTSPSISDFLYIFGVKYHVSIDYVLISKYIKYLVIVLVPITVILTRVKNDWKTIALVTLMMIWIGGFFGGYYQIYMIPALLIFITTCKEPTKLDIIYLVCFIFMFLALPNSLFEYEWFYLTSDLVSIGTLTMFILLMYEDWREIFTKVRNKEFTLRKRNDPE